MENEEIIPTPANEIDQLTMALLMNKQTYNKYISKQDPEKAKIIQEQQNEMDIYREKILNITQNKLDNPHLQITLTILARPVDTAPGDFHVWVKKTK